MVSLFITRTDTEVIQQWNGHSFKDTTLAALGITVQVGHHVGGGTCTRSDPRELTVLTLTSAHPLVVSYCACEGALPERIQLFRKRWFPAMMDNLPLAFTFDILDFYHSLQSRNKCSPDDFYRAVIQLTDAARLNPEKVCIFWRFSVVLLLIKALVPP
jgi:hypothetical protein